MDQDKQKEVLTGFDGVYEDDVEESLEDLVNPDNFEEVNSEPKVQDRANLKMGLALGVLVIILIVWWIVSR